MLRGDVVCGRRERSQRVPGAPPALLARHPEPNLPPMEMDAEHQREKPGSRR